MELPGVGDPLRKFGTHARNAATRCPGCPNAATRSRSTLDLRKPEGAAILKRLVAKADVLVENFQPGTLEKWGLGWDVLQRRSTRGS